MHGYRFIALVFLVAFGCGQPLPANTNCTNDPITEQCSGSYRGADVPALTFSIVHADVNTMLYLHDSIEAAMKQIGCVRNGSIYDCKAAATCQ